MLTHELGGLSGTLLIGGNMFNFAFWLSLVLAAAGCTGLLLAGKGKWYGWAVGLAVQPVWAAYAIVTKGYGLLLTCLMYGFVNARNLWKWKVENGTEYRTIKVGDILSVNENEAGLSVRFVIDEEGMHESRKEEKS